MCTEEWCLSLMLMLGSQYSERWLSCCSSNLQETTRYPQLYVYDICLTKFGEYHKWMAFLDVDEFLVLQPQAGSKKLPEFLRGYEDFGGLVANMKVFGSSGFKQRPPGSVLRNYLK